MFDDIYETFYYVPDEGKYSFHEDGINSCQCGKFFGFPMSRLWYVIFLLFY